MKKIPIISIIIPCYNHGHFIQDAIDSVLELKRDDYELIIVNDGSTDEYTIKKLKELELEGYNVISHQNKGLGATRNVGIAKASGKYILPLDADNKITPAYLEKAIPILESGEFDIVYGKPILFGQVSAGRTFTTKPFDLEELLVGNYIDACAIYRKDVWEKNGGYDTKMPIQGNEDWEFWLNAVSNSFKFYFINEPLCYYRIVENSMMISSLQLDSYAKNYQYLFKKHPNLYLDKFLEYYGYKRVKKFEEANPFRTCLKYLLKSLKIK